MDKSPDAFRTITEVAEWLDTPAHVLRFWESRFSQIKPVKRAGGRRYYRPIDMLLLGGIKKLLHDDGTTIKAVQNILREQGIKHVQSLSQPVSVKVSVKKKEPVAAKTTAPVNETAPAPKPIAAAPITPPPSPPAAAIVAETAPAPLQEQPSDPIIDPMAERAAMPADPISAPAPISAEIKAPEAQAEEPIDLIDDSDQTDDDDDLDLPQSASLGEPDITVVKFPETLKAASEVPYKDMQEIEALYYSLKMVRNNMKRTGAGR